MQPTFQLPRRLTFEFCARTHRGRVRENNEDALAFDEPLRSAVLADGMGGYNAGEIASSMTISHLLDALRRQLSSSADSVPDARRVRIALEQSVFEANDSVYEAAIANPSWSGMGTTLVAAVFCEPLQLVVAHIGDSRCYRLRAGVFTRLTHDHSMLQEQLDAGLLSRDQPAPAGLRNFLTRALGVEPMVEPEIYQYAVEPGDLYLLCSDGLNDMLDDARIAAIVSEPATLAQKADALIDAANSGGGRDNVSVLLVQTTDAAAAQPAGA